MNKFGQIEVQNDSTWYQYINTDNTGNGKICVTLANGVTEAGALFELSPCHVVTPLTPLPEKQKFYYESLTGELTSSVHSQVYDDRGDEVKLCFTAGWPFLYATAFIKGDDDAKKETVVVVVNEANSPTHIILSDSVKSLEGQASSSTSSTSSDTTSQTSSASVSSAGDLWFGINPRSIQTLVY